MCKFYVLAREKSSSLHVLAAFTTAIQGFLNSKTKIDQDRITSPIWHVSSCRSRFYGQSNIQSPQRTPTSEAANPHINYKRDRTITFNKEYVSHPEPYAWLYSHQLWRDLWIWKKWDVNALHEEVSSLIEVTLLNMKYKNEWAIKISYLIVCQIHQKESS